MEFDFFLIIVFYNLQDFATKKPLDNLPKDWKIATGFYKMCFTYKNRKKIFVECTGSVTGKTMLISGEHYYIRRNLPLDARPKWNFMVTSFISCHRRHMFVQ